MAAEPRELKEIRPVSAGASGPALERWARGGRQGVVAGSLEQASLSARASLTSN